MLAGRRPAWMGKPYSMDLRERAVAAVVSGGLSCRRAAKQFGLGVNTVITWVRRLRQTGSVAPGKMGGHRPNAIVLIWRAGGRGGSSIRITSILPAWCS